MIKSLDQSFSSLTGLESLLFVATLVSCWTAESICAKSDSQRKRRRACINGSFIIVALPIQLVMSGLCATVASYVTLHQLGLLYLIPLHANPVCKYVFMFILLDFLDYIYHYIMHHVPWLWRLHLVHHTDRRMDVSTTVREHPGETFVRNAFLISGLFSLGHHSRFFLPGRGSKRFRTSSLIAASDFQPPSPACSDGCSLHPTCTTFITTHAYPTPIGIMAMFSASGIGCSIRCRSFRPPRPSLAWILIFQKLETIIFCAVSLCRLTD